MTPQPSEQPRRYSVTRQTLASALHGLTVGRGGLATCYHAAEGSECSYTAARILQELAHEAAAPDPVASPAPLDVERLAAMFHAKNDEMGLYCHHNRRRKGHVLSRRDCGIEALAFAAEYARLEGQPAGEEPA